MFLKHYSSMLLLHATVPADGGSCPDLTHPANLWEQNLSDVIPPLFCN